MVHGSYLLKPPCQIHGTGVVEAKRNGGLDFSKPPRVICGMSAGKYLPVSGFFLFCRWADDFRYYSLELIEKNKINPIICKILMFKILLSMRIVALCRHCS